MIITAQLNWGERLRRFVRPELLLAYAGYEKGQTQWTRANELVRKWRYLKILIERDHLRTEQQIKFTSVPPAGNPFLPLVTNQLKSEKLNQTAG